MNLSRSLGILMLCLSLLLSNLANAAVPCCMMGDSEAQQVQSETTVDSAMEMPCHEMADNEQQSTNDCNDCGCDHCLQISLLPNVINAGQDHIEAAVHSDRLILYSKQPYALFHPPRLNS
jgi:hypothetical protein